MSGGNKRDSESVMQLVKLLCRPINRDTAFSKSL